MGFSLISMLDMGGINLSTDSYFPPEVEVRLVRLVSNRDYVSLGTGGWARCISYGCIQKYRNKIQSVHKIFHSEYSDGRNSFQRIYQLKHFLIFI